MIKRTNATLSAGKKKVLAFVLTGTLILALGSGIAYAANAGDTIIPKGIAVFAQVGNENGSILVKDEDGVRSYSIDEGKTWSQTAPDGLVEIPIEYSALPGAGILPEDGVSIGIRTDGDGTLSYSTDGGKTWSKEVPEGMTVSVDQDGNSASGKLETEGHLFIKQR